MERIGAIESDGPSREWACDTSHVRPTLPGHGHPQRSDTIAVVCGAGQRRSVAVAGAGLSSLADTDVKDVLARCKMGDISPQATMENYAREDVEQSKTD
jgi:hypothetical protein